MRNYVRVGVVAAAIALLAACAGTPPASVSSSSAAGSAAATAGAASASHAPINALFTYVNNLDVVTEWDPALSYSNEVIVMNNLYEQLTRSNPKTGTPEPLLATSWTTSADGLTWTFTLRDDVTFSTGNPMDAAAAKAAIERTISLKGGAAYIWDSVETIAAKDATTLEFTLKYAAPLDLIASSAYAAFIYDTKADAGDLTAWFAMGNAAGTGPYGVESWKKGTEDELKLKANENYWGGWDGSHYSSAVFKVVPEETTAVQLLQSGDGTFIPRVSSAIFASLQGQEGISTLRSPSFQNMLAMLNTASGPLADVNLRNAVAQAIDYDGIVTTLQGAMVKATGVVPEGLLGYTTDVQQTTDVEAAKATVAAAGYGPDKPLTLTLTYAAGDPEAATIVTLMKANLAAVGIDLQAKALAWETQWDLAKSEDEAKRQDIFVFYWYPDYADPYSWFINLYHSANPPFFNLSYWDDPQVDATIDGLQSVTATDREKAQEQYVDLQATISDLAISPVLGVTNYQRAFASSMTGYVDNPSYSNVVFIHDLTPTA
ncbi:MAG: ABC transporter substrate-binding protein [Candidatus Nanopelagicales bacterium]